MSKINVCLFNFTQFYSCLLIFREMSLNFIQTIRFRVQTMNNRQIENRESRLRVTRACAGGCPEARVHPRAGPAVGSGAAAPSLQLNHGGRCDRAYTFVCALSHLMHLHESTNTCIQVSAETCERAGGGPRSLEPWTLARW